MRHLSILLHTLGSWEAGRRMKGPGEDGGDGPGRCTKGSG